MKYMRMHMQHVVFRCALLFIAAAGMTACGGGSISASSTSITGSAGDGPVINGTVSVTDANGTAVVTTPASPKTDSTAHFSFTIPSNTPLPFTITITNGIDTVTGVTQDFDLTAVDTAPLPAGGALTININPISTLVVASARAKGTLNAANLAAATTNVLNTVGFTLPAGFDPTYTKVDTTNVAAVIKANEAAAELIRRTRVSTGKTMSNTITAIAEDISDGIIDGKVAAGITATQATARSAGVILTKQAEISAAILADQLAITDKNGVTRVTAADMKSKLNAALLVTEPTATGSAADVSQVKVTQKFIDQAENAVSLANILVGGGDSGLNNLKAAINAVSAGTIPGSTQTANILTALNNSGSALATADTNANAGTNTDVLTSVAGVSNAAPVFTGTPAISGTAATGNTLSLTGTATSDADGDTVTLSYQWYANLAVIAGATGATYMVQAGDAGKTITAVITADDNKNAANSAQSVMTAGATVSPVVDTTAPTLNSFTSTTADGNYKAGATINITATYNEAPAAGSSLTVSLNSGKTGLVLNTISGNTITGTYTVGASETSADLTVSAITAQSVSDTAGNTLTSTTLPVTNIAAGSAIVVDTTAPTIFSNNPASNATGVAVNAAIDITFSETMDTTTITTSTFTLTPSDGSALTGTSVNHNTGNNESLSHGDLAYNTTYTVTVSSAITDKAGNAVTATSWSFTTVQTFTVGGSVSGLGTSESVVLQNSGADNLTVNSNTTFTFATQVTDGAAYTVTVLTAPAGKFCTVGNGSGTVSGAAVSNVSVTCKTAYLNDTGITNWENSTSSTLTVTQASYPGQDADFGRDALALAGTLTKVGASTNASQGFDFTKLDSSGTALANQTAVYTTTAWDCVQDHVTGLMWEVKTTDGSIRDKTAKFSWYNTTSTTNGGNAGTANGGSCAGWTNCDTEKYVAAVNAGGGICGYTDWRLPKRAELLSIVDYSAPAAIPLIDTGYFPNTVSDQYWTASPDAVDASNATTIYFNSGKVLPTSLKSGSWYVRLVRGGQ